MSDDRPPCTLLPPPAISTCSCSARPGCQWPPDDEGVAAELGVDEDAPPSPLSAPVTAQQPPTVGQDRPDAHSGPEGRFWGEHPAHPTCIDVTNVRAGRPPGSEWMCGPDCPRQPERKADQA